MPDRGQSAKKSILAVVLGVFGAIAFTAPPAAAQCITPVFITPIIGCPSIVEVLGLNFPSATTVAIADFNRDGKLDVLVAEDFSNQVELAVLLGNGDGTFQAPIYLGGCCSPNYDQANWAIVGDFNGDGNPDIAAGTTNGFVNIWLGDGKGNFAVKQQFGATSCCTGPIAGAAGDFNGDGKLDLVVINGTTGPGAAQVYLGNGDGTFMTSPTVVTVGGQNANPNGVVVGDFNHDGHLDFATSSNGYGNNNSVVSVVLGNGNGTFQPAANYSSNATGQGANGISIVAADFNHDGYLDLAMLNGGSNAIAVFLNNGNGTFQNPSFYSAQGSVTDPAFPGALAVADFNKDGNPDLVFGTNWRGGVEVLLGNPDGTFRSPTWWVTDDAATGVATGDFNGDGNPDFVVSTSTNNSVTVVLGNGDGSFKSARSYYPSIISSGNFPTTALPNPGAVTFADFNGDGRPDMAVVDGANSEIAIFLNDGDGTFTESANYPAGGNQPPTMAVAADVNKDGKMDLVVSLSSTGTQSSFGVLLGNGDGTFQPAVAYSNGTGSGSDTIALADVNGDGKLDVISNTQQWGVNASFYVSLGKGDGTFQSAIATPALCPGGAGGGAVYLAAGDLNGDGKPDIAGACNAGMQQTYISVLLGKGDGTFGSPTQFAAGTTPAGIAIGDFNEDGKPDLVVVDNYPTPQVSLLQGNGNGTFQTPVANSIYPSLSWGGPSGPPSPDYIVAADFNLDGHLDFLVGDGNASQVEYNGTGSYNIGVQLFLGNGNGTFKPVQNYLAGRQATFLAVADLDGNGSPDVGVVSSSDHSVNILLNLGTALQSISVSPATTPVAVGLSQQFTATGHYSNGSTQILTTSVIWSSSNVAIASVSNTAGTRGLATGVAIGGPVSITAKLGNISGSAQLTVTSPVLVSIGITPANPSIPAGGAQQFTATGTYSDASMQNITGSVTWASSNTAVATISGSGVASAIAAGMTTISAKQGGVSNSTTVTVIPIQSITVSPVNPSMPVHSTLQFMATAHYSDGTTRDVSLTASWSSSNTSVATIASPGGLATGVGKGTTTITAAAGAVSGFTMLTVTRRVIRDFAGDGLSGELLYDPIVGTTYTALSNGNGTYSYTGGLFTAGLDILRTGDFNGDGKADMVLYNSHTALAYIGMGNGDGTFNFQSLFWSPGYDFVEPGDLNGDAKTDFALYNSSTGTMYTGISNGDGTFTYKYTLVSKGFTFVRLADFTGDGKADIFLYRASDGLAFLGIGDGAGGFTFHPVITSSGYSLGDIGDLNGDGKADVILYNPNGNAATGISDGVGGFAFTPLLFSPAFTSIRLADYTGDGLADATVYNKNTATAYFGTGDGAGNFSFQSLFWSPGYNWVEPEDVNGDGKFDVILYNSTTGTEYTGISNGNGTFTYTYTLWGPGKVLAR